MKDILRSKKRLISILAPTIIGLMYITLCFVALKRSIWFDESYSAYLTRFSFKDIWTLTSADVHPPLFYYLLKTWSHFFGHTDFAMRAMSTMFGALAIVFLYVWLKYKYGVKAAILSTFLVAISPVFVRYGQEMRMYTVVFMLVCASSLFLHLGINTKEKKWWVLYGITVALGMWTHYFSAFAWAAQAIYLIRIYGKNFFKHKIFLCYVLAVLLYIPWIPGLLSQVSTVEGNGFWIAEPSIKTLADYLAEIFLYARAEEVKNWLLVLALATIVMAVLLFVRYFKKFKYLAVMCTIPVIILTLLSMPPLRSMFVSRYVMYSMVLLQAFLGICIVAYSRTRIVKKTKLVRPTRLAGLMSILLIVTSVFGLISVYQKGNYNFNTYSRPSAKELYEVIVGLDGNDNLPIISTSTWLYYDLSFYTTNEHSVYFVDELSEYPYGSLLPLERSDVGKIDDLDTFLENHDSVWLVDEKGDDIIEFPREGWEATLISDIRINDDSPTYQVVLYQRN